MLDNGKLVECAAELGLDIPQFLRELSEDLHLQRIQNDVHSGIESGVERTPTIFINEMRYDGNLNEICLATAIRTTIDQLEKT